MAKKVQEPVSVETLAAMPATIQNAAVAARPDIKAAAAAIAGAILMQEMNAAQAQVGVETARIQGLIALAKLSDPKEQVLFLSGIRETFTLADIGKTVKGKKAKQAPPMLKTHSNFLSECNRVIYNMGLSLGQAGVVKLLEGPGTAPEKMAALESPRPKKETSNKKEEPAKEIVDGTPEAAAASLEKATNPERASIGTVLKTFTVASENELEGYLQGLAQRCVQSPDKWIKEMGASILDAFKAKDLAEVQGGQQTSGNIGVQEPAVKVG